MGDTAGRIVSGGLTGLTLGAGNPLVGLAGAGLGALSGGPRTTTSTQKTTRDSTPITVVDKDGKSWTMYAYGPETVTTQGKTPGSGPLGAAGDLMQLFGIAKELGLDVNMADKYGGGLSGRAGFKDPFQVPGEDRYDFE